MKHGKARQTKILKIPCFLTSKIQCIDIFLSLRLTSKSSSTFLSPSYNLPNYYLKFLRSYYINELKQPTIREANREKYFHISASLNFNVLHSEKIIFFKHWLVYSSLQSPTPHCLLQSNLMLTFFLALRPDNTILNLY